MNDTGSSVDGAENFYGADYFCGADYFNGADYFLGVEYFFGAESKVGEYFQDCQKDSRVTSPDFLEPIQL